MVVVVVVVVIVVVVVVLIVIVSLMLPIGISSWGSGPRMINTSSRKPPARLSTP